MVPHVPAQISFGCPGAMVHSSRVISYGAELVSSVMTWDETVREGRLLLSPKATRWDWALLVIIPVVTGCVSGPGEYERYAQPPE